MKRISRMPACVQTLVIIVGGILLAVIIKALLLPVALGIAWLREVL